MKSVLRTLLAASLVCVTPQLAKACPSVAQLSQPDIAFADVIFEGRLKDIRYVPVDWSKDRASFIKLTFDVHNVVRGELQQNEIVIGWKLKSYINSQELSVEDFYEAFSETTRVAISTPQLASLFCELKLRSGKFYDEGTGTHVYGKRMRHVCDSSAESLEFALKENIPFVLSNGRCGSSYLYAVQKYEKMRDYDKNLRAFKQAVGTGQRSSSELILEKNGEGSPLPWGEFGYRPIETIATDLFREETVFFTPSLKTNVAWQEFLMDLGEVKMKEYGSSFPRGEAARVKFRKSLNSTILRLIDYMEKDPEYRDRLLHDD